MSWVSIANPKEQAGLDKSSWLAGQAGGSTTGPTDFGTWVSTQMKDRFGWEGGKEAPDKAWDYYSALWDNPQQGWDYLRQMGGRPWESLWGTAPDSSNGGNGTTGGGGSTGGTGGGGTTMDPNNTQNDSMFAGEVPGPVNVAGFNPQQPFQGVPDWYKLPLQETMQHWGITNPDISKMPDLGDDYGSHSYYSYLGSIANLYNQYGGPEGVQKYIEATRNPGVTFYDPFAKATYEGKMAQVNPWDASGAFTYNVNDAMKNLGSGPAVQKIMADAIAAGKTFQPPSADYEMFGPAPAQPQAITPPTPVPTPAPAPTQVERSIGPFLPTNFTPTREPSQPVPSAQPAAPTGDPLSQILSVLRQGAGYNSETENLYYNDPWGILPRVGGPTSQMWDEALKNAQGQGFGGAVLAKLLGLI